MTLTAAFVAIGFASDSPDRYRYSRGFDRRPSLRWVDHSEVLQWADNGSNRQYALDMLSLEYLPDYTSDQQVIERIARIYWCGTPLLLEKDNLSAEEISEAALRRRAQSLVESYIGSP